MIRSVYTANTLEEAWFRALRVVVRDGGLINDKDPFYEVQNLHIAYRNAFETDVDNYISFVGTEFIEYIHRVYSPSGDQKTGRNYYRLIYEQDGINQVERVIELLKTDPLTRSATIVLADAKSIRQPCITEINFSVRENVVHMTILFKSSDLLKKFVPDLVEASEIHKKITSSLSLGRGRVALHILSAQIYKADLLVTKKIINSKKATHYYKTEMVVENWDKEASQWDLNIKKPDHYVNIENGYGRFIQFLEDKIPKAQDKINISALDSGCGTGIIAEALAEKGYKVNATDISPQMLHCAHRNFTSVSYVLANSLDLPFADNSFNVVCSRGVLISHVGKRYAEKFLDEHNRVLRTDGLFMFDFITHFQQTETRKKRSKAHFSYKTISQLLVSHGFEILERTGDDFNRVNAVLCKKI